MRRLFPFLAFAVSALALPSPEAWIPLQWPSEDPASLSRLEKSPFNCLIQSSPHWSAAFVRAAHAQNRVLLAQPSSSSPNALANSLAEAKRALDLGYDGLLWEGDAAALAPLRALGKPVVHLGLRSEIPLDANAPPIIGTRQGVWAGINPQDDDSHKAAPSGGPWIDTNSGFLRYLRAATDRTVWISAPPPNATKVPLSRYLMLLGDAGMLGARWVLNLPPDFFANLLQGETKATKDFARLSQLASFLEAHRSWSRNPAYGQLAVIEDVANGALLSGSILDMIGVKHTPVRPVPTRALSPAAFADAKMAVNVDPPSLSPEQTQIVRGFTRSGGTVLTAPPDWRMPEPQPGQVTLGDKDVEKLDQIWKEVNTMTGRRNLGARLFNVSSMLSSMTVSPDAKTIYIYLTNYSDYPVDTIAIHLLGKFSKATVHWPERPAKVLELYDNEDGSGADIDILESTAILVAEK
ncbi:MAG: hypothetical protein NW208_17795 [Bryobacter sp.]|nr:hypothetical protein [Bryobacter sp.]